MGNIPPNPNMVPQQPYRVKPTGVGTFTPSPPQSGPNLLGRPQETAHGQEGTFTPSQQSGPYLPRHSQETVHVQEGTFTTSTQPSTSNPPASPQTTSLGEGRVKVIPQIVYSASNPPASPQTTSLGEGQVKVIPQIVYSAYNPPASAQATSSGEGQVKITSPSLPNPLESAQETAQHNIRNMASEIGHYTPQNRPNLLSNITIDSDCIINNIGTNKSLKIIEAADILLRCMMDTNRQGVPMPTAPPMATLPIIPTTPPPTIAPTIAPITPPITTTHAITEPFKALSPQNYIGELTFLAVIIIIVLFIIARYANLI